MDMTVFGTSGDGYWALTTKNNSIVYKDGWIGGSVNYNSIKWF